MAFVATRLALLLALGCLLGLLLVPRRLNLGGQPNPFANVAATFSAEVASVALSTVSAPAPLAAPSGRRLKVAFGKRGIEIDGQPVGKSVGKVFGVGGFAKPELARRVGFEAFRTWGLDQMRWVIKEMDKTNFMLMAGIDMTRDPKYYQGKHCGDLEKSKFWKGEAQRILTAVEKYQWHPGILLWLVGNELETPINAKNGSECLWQRVNWMAGKVKSVDNNHPCGIALAGVARPKVQQIVKICTNLDVLGTNVYGNDIRDIGGQFRAAGWNKPWAFTECGPLGPWEVPRTSWGAAVEQSSTAKGKYLERGLRMCEEDDLCVGFTAFLWGWKWEKTGTWFGLIDSWKDAYGHGFLNDIGQPLYDEFGQKPDTNFRIHIHKFLVDEDKEAVLGFSALRGAEVQLDLWALATWLPAAGDNAAWGSWFVTRETPVNPKSDGNIAEQQLPTIPAAIEVCPNTFRAKLKTWELEEGGNYRLYGFARRTNHGGLPGYPSIVEASVSIPFHIGPQNCTNVTKGWCFDEVTRAMTAARRMGVTSWPAAGLEPTSSFQEFQASFHIEGQAGCPAPCSVEIKASSRGNCDTQFQDPQLRYVNMEQMHKMLSPPKMEFSKDEEKCHNAKPPEDCFYAVEWLMNTGIWQQPASFPEVNANSSRADAQLALWKRVKNGCKRPCHTS